jgi:hypothetical protein
MMKSIKYLAAFSLLLLAVSCYQKQELDYSKWYPKDEVNTDKPNEEADTLMLMSSNVRFYSARNKAEDPDVGERDWEVRKTGYFQNPVAGIDACRSAWTFANNDSDGQLL